MGLNSKRHTLLLTLLLLLSLPTLAVEGEFPAYYVTTTNLNVRTADRVGAKRLATVPKGTTLWVDGFTSRGWAAVRDRDGNVAYVSGQYIRYVGAVQVEPLAEEVPTDTGRTGGGGWKSVGGTLWSWVWQIGLALLVAAVLRKVGLYVLAVASMLMYRLYWVLCLPFYVLNWLQRWLSKPWRIAYKMNGGNDRRNAELREQWEWWKVPLYLVLTPLRLVNAVYYNLVVHLGFELYNYAVEVVVPSNDKEGADNTLLALVLIPWRVLRYVVWHGSLTLIESVVWTVVDTFVPALTLFHGTDADCSVNITHAGRSGYSNDQTGIWHVGAGNFAGNGIYFAPARNTALHYARTYSDRALIVCRVSLGRVLDLGLAPMHVFRQCGHANALEATRWGLNNGYTTGEWWRPDGGWWEYCLYDWQNRYNYSWRIRPLYVLNLTDQLMQRIPGGMCHWLFRGLVIKDILTYFEKEVLK